MDIGKVNVCFTAAAPSVAVPLYIRPTPDELAVDSEEWADINAALTRESAQAQRAPDRFPLPKWKG